MREITALLICLACGGHGHRVNIATDHASGGLYEKHKVLEGESDSLASIRSRTSLNQSSGVPLKTLQMVLLAAEVFASSSDVPSNMPFRSAPPNAALSKAESQSAVNLDKFFAKPHLNRPLISFGQNMSEFVQEVNSDIGKLPFHTTLVARSKGAIIPRVKQMSSLMARSKHIYDLQSGEILLLRKRDSDAESLQTENHMLQIIQQAGIPVVPHKLIKTINPMTGNIVKGMIQTKVTGTFVRFKMVEVSSFLLSREKLTSFLAKEYLTLDPTATRNLKDDLLRIRHASKSGLQIRDMQGIIQPDGHFILIDPLGVTLPGGKYVGNFD